MSFVQKVVREEVFPSHGSGSAIGDGCMGKKMCVECRASDDEGYRYRRINALVVGRGNAVPMEEIRAWVIRACSCLEGAGGGVRDPIVDVVDDVFVRSVEVCVIQYALSEIVHADCIQKGSSKGLQQSR